VAGGKRVITVPGTRNTMPAPMDNAAIRSLPIDEAFDQVRQRRGQNSIP
jgi:hypothetical protein